MTKDFYRLMEASRVLKKWDTQAEVARQLSLDDQIMTNWKARGVPRQRILELSRQIGCNPFWLENGEGQMSEKYIDPKIQAVIQAMQDMPDYKKDILVQTSTALAEQTKPKNNGTQ